MKPEIYNKLAASGRYLNTGKVLIGLQHIPVQRRVTTRDEDRVQSALLGHKVLRLEYHITIYMLYLIGVCTLIAALVEMVK